MSTVDKMLIKGIRSFDPENRNVITFFKPLTLIVGPNGAGKTTIIECLKLSCTGELPPNARSGHSFIHDPKVAGETETKAQIKLRFKTAAGKDVVCIRSFQLTQKASKMEYKAIESVLQTLNPHTGEKVCLSYRCADMDREIPALMGVSKAILENVIFVHQDESNWPVQDSSTLKKKFDDIFSATRYTKALEVIKKLHKDQSVEIKSYKLKLENLQTLKDAAYNLRESISQDQEKTEVLENQMQELEKNIKNVESKIDHNKTTLKELQEIKYQISMKTTKRSTLVEEQEKKYNNLSEEIEDSDAELNEWKTKFDERIMLLENKISKLQRDKKDLEETMSSSKSRRESNIKEISKLQRDAENNVREKDERDSIIRRLYANYNLGHLQSAPFTDDVAMELEKRVVARSKELDKNLDEKKRSNGDHLKTAWNSYESADERWKNAEARKQAKLEIKKNILKRLEEKKNERQSLELQLSDIDFSQIDAKERIMQVELERKKKQLDERDFKSNIETKEEHLHRIDSKIKLLSRERDEMATDANNRIELSMRKSELENQKKRHKKIIDEHKDKIRGVLKGRLPSDKDLKKDITQALRTLQRELTDLTAKARDAEKEVNMLQAKIQEVNDNLSKHRKDLDSRKRFIVSRLQSLEQQTFAVDSYPKFFEMAKEKRDVQKSKYNIADGMRQMFDPFEKVARAHHICPCCERPFSAEDEDNFVRKQRLKAASSAEHMKVLALESSNAESILQQMDKLRIVYEEYVKLEKEVIPHEEEKLQELSEKLEQKSQDLDDVIGILAQVEAEKDAAQNLMGPVDTAAALLQEIQSLQNEIDKLDFSFPLGGLGVRTMQEVQLELNSLQETKDDLHGGVSSLRDQQYLMQQELSSLEVRWRNIREEKINLANALENAKRLDEELEGLVEEESQTDLEIQHLEETISILFREKDKLLSDYKSLKDRHDREYGEEMEHKMKYEQEVDRLHRATSKIEEYLVKEQKLKEVQKQQSVIESQLQNYEMRLREVMTELQKNNDLRSNQDQLRRNIEDNLNYRKTKLEVEECTREIELLEEKMLKIGRIENFEVEADKFSQEKERLLSELNRCRGTSSVYRSNISKNKLDLKQAQYKDIDKRYSEQLIQLKTTEMANKDLDRYYNALDKALMRFHTMKMEETNKIIRELWQQTYRAQDIDYICIHSDSEGAGTRSYSYKVLMQTGDALLEMRGRCSAGQKVLASLIIRLALAETFCLNCGILALDEPTTNLDGPNSESLAAALLKIMEDRKGQENFQLIVITHDERFAQLIGQRQHAERYYRVAKDDHQHSIIEAQAIFD